MSFRERLLATLAAMQPVLDVANVLVIGSEVPNLLEHRAASTLVVSEDVDVAVPVAQHQAVKTALGSVRGLHRSNDEPSVWSPDSTSLIEVNFVGMDPDLARADESYVLADRELPLLVFGSLSFLRADALREIDGVRVRLPRPAGLMLEKLVTDRTGDKGERDLLVVMGLLLTCGSQDEDELATLYSTLESDLRHVVRANLALLSLMKSHSAMPDPRPHRARLAALLQRLEAKP